VATWAFGEIAVRKASEHLSLGESAADAAEAGVNAVERDNEDQYFVGLGGLPNAEGCMEFDAAIMEGRCLVRNPPKAMRLTRGARAGSGCRLGAVAGLQGTVCAVSVARAVMQHSPHNFLVGDGAIKVPTTPAPRQHPRAAARASRGALASPRSGAGGAAARAPQRGT
jgi:N4-(beta-N-acetylglucosaminyl)-L-asparaginase